MRRPHLDEDIKPLSEFRAHASALLQRIRDQKRPLVLTQRGHSAAVVVDVSEYERMIDELELLRDVRIAEEQLERGEGVSHADARSRLLGSLER